MKEEKFIGILDDSEYYANITKFVEKIKERYTNLVVVALGGSFAAAKSIIDIVLPNKNVRFIYFLDEIVIKNSLNGLLNEETLFLFISKSGRTVEVISLYEIIVKYGFTNFICITNTQDSTEQNFLKKIAIENNYELLHHEEDISGRFSFTSNVFFIPTLFSGLDFSELLRGFKDGKNANTLKLDNKIFNILMCYDTRFEAFNNWYVQIFAESLGKKGYNCIPISNIGTRDQHSVLEYYLNNPEDKFITFVIKNTEDSSVKINLEQLFEGKKDISIHQIKYQEFEATKMICDQVHLENRVIEMENFDEYNIAKLMMSLSLEILDIAREKGINPFIQDMVEARKKINFKRFS